MKNWKGIAIALGSLILIALIVICAIPLKTVSYTANVSYQEVETYYVSEPYQVQEKYTVQEPYTVREKYTVREPYTRKETYWEREPYLKSVPVDYMVTKQQIYQWWSTGSDARVYIRNTDIKSGRFYVTFYLVLRGGAETTKSASKYIAIGDTEKVEVKYSGARIDSFTYAITPPTKTVTDYRNVKKTRLVIDYKDVTKYRDVVKYKTVTKYGEVTKYRDVEKQRTVTKYRQETLYKKITMLEYLTS